MPYSEHLLSQLFPNHDLPLVMGILNVTADSFSDGALYLSPESALLQAKTLLAQGADIIDIGGESTRPGAMPVDALTELNRTIPVIRAIREFSDVPISIDTRKAQVAEEAILAGAQIVNDVSALSYDPEIAAVLRKHTQIAVVFMHAQGTPETMQLNPVYQDVCSEVADFMADTISQAASQGIEPNRIILDPGIGFGKLLEHNLQLLANLEVFHSLQLPLLLGASRKRFINEIIPSAPLERIGGSLAATMFAMQAGFSIVRVHDVSAQVQFIRVFRAIVKMRKAK